MAPVSTDKAVRPLWLVSLLRQGEEKTFRKKPNQLIGLIYNVLFSIYRKFNEGDQKQALGKFLGKLMKKLSIAMNKTRKKYIV